MRRRSFIGSCAGAAAAMTIARHVSAAPQAKSSDAARAVGALQAAKQLEAKGEWNTLRAAYHSDAIRVEPGSLQPNVGRAAIAEGARQSVSKRKLLYFYYRQPDTVSVGNASLVVSNYEAGYSIDGKISEESGKTTGVVLLGPREPLIAQDVVVPNIYAGGYGPLGTALSSPRFGLFPLRVLGPEPAAAKSAGGGENDVLFKQVQQINDSWVSGRPEDLLKYASSRGVFLIGDYSPYYISGAADIRQHFADFYKTSKVSFVRETDPTVRIWGDMAAVAFNFDLDYTINGTARRSPGRAVYTFTRGTPGPQWRMAACAASHLVVREIGDPYPFG